MSSYYYKATAPSVLAAALAWDEKRTAFHAQREKMADIFGWPGSPMRSGNDNCVGGVKISASKDLDAHWCRPDDHGYRSLRISVSRVKDGARTAAGAVGRALPGAH